MLLQPPHAGISGSPKQADICKPSPMQTPPVLKTEGWTSPEIVKCVWGGWGAHPPCLYLGGGGGGRKTFHSPPPLLKMRLGTTSLHPTSAHFPPPELSPITHPGQGSPRIPTPCASISPHWEVQGALLQPLWLWDGCAQQRGRGDLCI